MLPVGSIVEWAPVDGNKTDLSTPAKVAAYYGFGVWEAYAPGRMLMGASDTYPVGSEGGEAQHTLTEPEIPTHSHQLHGWAYQIASGSSAQYAPTTPYDEYDNTNLTTRPAGGGQPHNNLPPYRATYIWRRTA